jgi:hypothetical protein
MTHRSLIAMSILLVVAGCERKSPEQPSTPATSRAAAPVPTPTVPGPAREPTASLDTGALNQREDPDRLLRFYAAALHARDWAAAAKAWGAGSGVTATTLKASYDRNDPPMLELGKGDAEGAAGSIYYEAPVTLRFGTAAPEHGSLVLRRVNDVPGATPEQRRWHIERSTIGQGE